jgi:hypothetical protein
MRMKPTKYETNASERGRAPWTARLLLSALVLGMGGCASNPQ